MDHLEYIHNLQCRKNQICDQCPYVSRSVFCMLNHVRRHQYPTQLFGCANCNVELYYCKSCDINCDTIIHLRIHIKEKHSPNEKIEDCTLKSYICGSCSFATSSGLESLKHVRHGCLKKEINDVLRQWRDILKHKITKHRVIKAVSWFKCKKCIYKSTKKSNLETHITVKHTVKKGRKWFGCEKCTYVASSESHLKIHIMSKHTDDKDKNWFYCDKCTYKVITKHNLKSHIMAMHTDDQSKKWFYCGKCNYKAARKCTLNQHIMARHTDDKDKKWLRCGKCTYKGLFKSQLNRHMAKHTDNSDKK